MKLLHGQKLVNELRNLTDSVEKRLWIAVPYIGSPTTIGKILGNRWKNSSSVSIKLLTDISDLSCINSETIKYFHKKGEVKTLTGLHAKIYIVDDTCILTSANLTETAFSKRYEVGVFYDYLEAKQVIETFNSWWKISEKIKPKKLNKIISNRHRSNEDRTGVSLRTLWKLPPSPDSLFNSNETNVRSGGGYYIVNTNRKYSVTAYKEMLSEEKASAYGNKSRSISRIKKGDIVFLYHKGVGIVTYGRTIDKAKPNDENEEVYIKMKFDWKVDPIDEPEKVIKVSEINEELASGYTFPQTVFIIPDKMVSVIQKLALKKAPENMT